jgi:hypothetical protein
MKTMTLSFFALLVCEIGAAQNPLSISYTPPSEVNTNLLSPLALAAAPKECVIDLHYSAPNVRVVMESPDGLTTYLDRVFALEVQALPDSTYVYGQPGAWTIGLGQFESINAFRVRLLNPAGIGLGAAIAQGSYP